MQTKTLARVQGVYLVLMAAGLIFWGLAFFLGYYRLISPIPIEWVCSSVFVIAFAGLVLASVDRQIYLTVAVPCASRFAFLVHHQASASIFEALGWLIAAAVVTTISLLSQEKKMVQGLTA